ncbi:MAG: S8 family serine peptidase [bacterium]|nr:S8 family serine peptidase [bacterium]
MKRLSCILVLTGFLIVPGSSCSSGGDDGPDFLTLFLLFNFLQSQACGTVSDPLFGQQWHLSNTGQRGGVSGEDARVASVWNSGVCGAGISMSVIDDGLAIAHEDLSPNIEAGLSYDYTTGGTDPSSSSANHGTSVGGIMAARSNTIGVRGAAPLASLRGYNYLANATAGNEADAMTRGVAGLHISNNSWGPTDLTGSLQSSTSTWRAAIDTGLSSGRSGLGTLYFWAAGNGGAGETDNSNYDGYANYHGVIAICAVGQDGKRASYSEQGANLWVCAHSQGNDSVAISTTDNIGGLGYNASGASGNFTDNNYTNTFNGTSAASPLAAGVGALVLQANPALSYRDVRLILAQSARKNDAADADWTTNAAGLNINHKYGFGTVDALAAVNLARGWVNVAAQKTFTPPTNSPSSAIPDNNATGITGTINVSGSGITSIEFVEINLTFTHAYYRDLTMTLTSPSGTASTLMSTGVCRNPNTLAVVACSPTGSQTVRFGVARTLGESADGNWTLRLADGAASDTGTFTSWSMKLYGR